MTLQVIILAAGEGKRMHSSLTKVLHKLAGKPLLEHVIITALQLSPINPPIIVYGKNGKILQEHFGHFNVRWIEQPELNGTGHAVLQTLPDIDDNQQVLILYGDVPLVSLRTLKKLIDAVPQNAIGIVTAHLENPKGYGRIQRNAQHEMIGIIEEKDASEEDLTISEINPGIYFLPAAYLKKWLPELSNQNAQKEYYLTDIISRAVNEKIQVCAIQPEFTEEILGVNDRIQLADLERCKQKRLAEQLMQQGVTLYDPARLDIRGDVHIGSDVIIDVNVILEGRVEIGNDCVIGPNTILRNVIIGDHSEIKANSMLDGVEVGTHCFIGPFARLRPGTILENHAHIGNFVEVKNSEIGQNTKINHLSYIGDSQVGKWVNIGAGTITCNYDGLNKHRTVIGDDVHIGSDTQLVAPVVIHDGATIGAGSTITKDAPAKQLTVTHRLEQRSVCDWQRPGVRTSVRARSVETETE